MALQEIYDQTVALDELIKGYGREDRDAFIEKLQRLLDARETLMKELPSHCSDSERQIGREIEEMNQRINQSLHSIKQEITNDMSQFRHRKKTVNRYRNPYSGPTKDGMFLDKRE
jgi:flagellar protein FliT